jgi:hypothetical protein
MLDEDKKKIKDKERVSVVKEPRFVEDCRVNELAGKLVFE